MPPLAAYAFRALAVLGAALAVAGCSGRARAISVSITNPADGDSIAGTAVHITLAVSGIELAPAAEARAGTAHHHLYLDVEFPAIESPIPSGMTNIVHLGQAQTDYHWQGLTPGAHRIIAVLADPGHLPLVPHVTDTVNIVVVPPDTGTGTR